MMDIYFLDLAQSRVKDHQIRPCYVSLATPQWMKRAWSMFGGLLLGHVRCVVHFECDWMTRLDDWLNAAPSPFSDLVTNYPADAVFPDSKWCALSCTVVQQRMSRFKNFQYSRRFKKIQKSSENDLWIAKSNCSNEGWNVQSCSFFPSVGHFRFPVDFRGIF